MKPEGRPLQWGEPAPRDHARSPTVPLRTLLIGCVVACLLAAVAVLIYLLPPGGSGRGLSDAQYAALVRCSDTLPPPQPGQWLWEADEPGQTFEQFVSAHWGKPDALRHTIYLQPLGDYGGGPDTAVLGSFARAYFMLSVVVLPGCGVDSTNVVSRTNTATGRRQLLSSDILYFLRRQVPADAYCLAAVTMEDLYPRPSWDFVFGEASLVNHVAVFSLARYSPAFGGDHDRLSLVAARNLVLRRSCKVLAHEVGHLFGLYHCIYYRCVMNGSNSLPESDGKPIELCPVCLGKLRCSAGFEVPERYAKLQAFYQGAGLSDEAREAGLRLDVLRAAGR
jgi:archaemetzincin